eukprot:3891905-Pyramimonas_sp.AAC.1
MQAAEHVTAPIASRHVDKGSASDLLSARLARPGVTCPCPASKARNPVVIARRRILQWEKVFSKVGRHKYVV